ncbi:adenosine receptor A3-like isoform X1 [Falco rusticolus]|uniref:adenosine receptor A3-like isoform X1 n=1 Tax=Falco rusticolus TaxID=120794 RepID=UPI0018865E80|nr:adenosine receptor A3-like isoform X1 [Falco rusticolus]
MSKMSVGSLEVIYITLESVTGIFAVVGNALVTWAVKLNPALQKTTFFYFVSLALTDIAMGILVIPLAVMVSLGVIIHFYSCLFMCCLMMIFSHASILSLLAIAVDRYLRVKLPTSFFTWILLPLLVMCALCTEIFYVMWIKLSRAQKVLQKEEQFVGRNTEWPNIWPSSSSCLQCLGCLWAS